MEHKAFIQSYLEKMRDIEEILLTFLENEENNESNFTNLIQIINDQKIHDNKNELKLLLHLISKISDNHHRTNTFFSKIEQTLKIFKDDFTKYFTNFDIFNIFKKNKRILLYLFEEKIINPDKSIYYIITNKKYTKRFYPNYFLPEFKSFYNENMLKEINESCSDEPSLFEQKRKIGENDKNICQLIKSDNVSEFISFCNKENLPISKAKIECSIFETNQFLLKNHPTLIEYAAFYGSIQIFKHLLENNVDLQPSIWLYAIHSNNEELIHFIKEKVPIFSFKSCLRESIKCHNIKLINYVKNNCNKNDQPLNNYYFCQGLQFYNFIEFVEKIDEDLGDFLRFVHNDYKSGKPQNIIFYDFCKFDYISIVDYFFKRHKGINNPDNIKLFKFFLYRS